MAPAGRQLKGVAAGGSSRWPGATALLVLLVVVPVGLRVLAVEEVSLQGKAVVRFADRQEAARILGTDDIFASAMGPQERALRMGTGSDAGKGAFLEYAAAQVLEFTEPERAKLTAALASLDRKLAALGADLRLPQAISIVKTTGMEEMDAPYCRGTAIVLPRRLLAREAPQQEQTITHELFHIISTANPNLRREMYAIVGFQTCPDVPLPEELASRRLTNPDAVGKDCWLEVGFQGRRLRLFPILLLPRDVWPGGSPFDNMVLRLLAVEESEGQWRATTEGGKALVLDPDQAPEYVRRLGGNTSYIIHPEEALADNFVLLVNGTTGLRDPQVPARMKDVLARPARRPNTP